MMETIEGSFYIKFACTYSDASLPRLEWGQCEPKKVCIDQMQGIVLYLRSGSAEYIQISTGVKESSYSILAGVGLTPITYR